MHEVTVKRTVALPAAEAWRIVDDFGGVYRYHPLVERSPILNGVGSGLGAQRTCHFHDGNAIVEEITGYEAGRSYQVDIIDAGSFPLRTARATLSVEPRSERESDVSFRMAFQPKYGLFGWLMAKAVMERQFAKILGRVLDGIDEHGRTGQVVGAPHRPAAA